jgi:ABC-2 type transport system permease protein
VRALVSEAQLIFAEEFRRSTHRTAYVVITLLIPAALVVLLAVVPLVRAFVGQQEEGPPKPIGIVSLSEELGPVVNVPGVRTYGDADSATAALTERKISELFIIADDYVESGRVEWLHRGRGLIANIDPGPSGESSGLVQAILRATLAREELPPELLARALAPAVFQQVRVGVEGPMREVDQASEFSRAVVSFGSALLLLFAIMMGASSLVQTVAEDKENRMIEVLLTSARPVTIMAGKVLAVGAAGLFQIAVWVASILIILPRIFAAIPDVGEFRVDPLVMLWLVVFFLAGYFVSGAIMAGLGAAATGVREAAQLSGLILIPLLVPIYAASVLLSEPNGTLARALSFVPFTAPTTMMIRLSVGDPPVLEILASLAVTVLAAVALLWVAARIFRAGLLMYGQRMGVRRAVAAVRQAG